MGEGEDAERSRAREEQGAEEEATAPETASAPPTESRPPVDRAFARLGRGMGGRSLSVYGVLLAGAAVLLILLAIIWLTAGDGGDGDTPTCVNMDLTEALARIKAAEVERISIAFDGENPSFGPALLSLETTDGECHNLQPQGIEGQPAIYAVYGAAEYFNETSGERQIRISFHEEVQPDLLWTPTATPSPTVEPTITPTPSPTVEPATPTALPPTPTATPTAPPASPVASPEASPVA